MRLKDVAAEFGQQIAERFLLVLVKGIETGDDGVKMIADVARTRR